MSHRNPNETNVLFQKPMVKADPDDPVYWSSQPFGDDLINAIGPAVDALVASGDWPFKLHRYALNNGVFRSGNMCLLTRANVPSYIISLIIHVTSSCLGAANQKQDTNMKPYGYELMNTLRDILQVTLVISTGKTRFHGS